LGTTQFVKAKLWPSVNYEPHKHQRLIHASRARHRLGCAGRRFGKSQIGGHELTVEALRTYALRNDLKEQAKRREFWIVGPEYSDSEKEFRVLWNDSKRLELPMDKPGSYNNPDGGPMILSLWDGTFQVHAMSAKHPETLVGEGLSGVVMAEAAKLKQLVWTKFIRPTLADFGGWSLWLSTPEGKNWFYDMYMQAIDPAFADWEGWRLPSWFNTVIFPEGRQSDEIVSMHQEMSQERFNQEVGASFTEFVGRVFKQFDEETHVRTIPYDPRWPLYACCDYGWSNPFVWLLIQVDVWDNVYVIGEYRRVQMDIKEIAAELQTWRNGISRQVTRFYPDPEAPGDSSILSKTLRVPFDGGTGGELKYRLEYIRQHLKPIPEHVPEEERVPKLLIDRSCTGLIKEMDDYRYPDKREDVDKEQPENPLKKDDHAPEALGRFFRGYFGDPTIEQRGSHARVRRASVG
jgi:hypothetical protein